jgi:Holliday junction resolvasome RuvABC DNA-binding subunit
MVLELKDKMAGAGAADGAVALPGAAPSLTALETDVLSALLNLGSSRAAAEEAVRKAKEKGVEESFEPLFRAAMGLLR